MNTTKNTLGTDTLPPHHKDDHISNELTRQWFAMRDRAVASRTKDLTKAAMSAASVADERFSPSEYADLLLRVVVAVEEKATVIATDHFHDNNLSLNDYIYTHYPC